MYYTDWFKIGKEYNKAGYCHPAYLTYLQNTSCEMPARLDESQAGSSLPGEIVTVSDMQMVPLEWQKAKRK